MIEQLETLRDAFRLRAKQADDRENYPLEQAYKKVVDSTSELIRDLLNAREQEVLSETEHD